MSLNLQLLMDVLVVGIIAEVIGLQTVQMVKPMLATSKYIMLLSLFINMGAGMALTLFFTDGPWQLGLFVGFFAWIGADVLYQALSKGVKLPSHADLVPFEDRLGSVLTDADE